MSIRSGWPASKACTRRWPSSRSLRRGPSSSTSKPRSPRPSKTSSRRSQPADVWSRAYLRPPLHCCRDLGGRSVGEGDHTTHVDLAEHVSVRALGRARTIEEVSVPQNRHICVAHIDNPTQVRYPIAFQSSAEFGEPGFV